LLLLLPIKYATHIPHIVIININVFVCFSFHIYV